MGVLSTLRVDSVLSAVSEHRWESLLAVASLPALYYALRFGWWVHCQKPMWNTLDEFFPGPKKHWLYGNLHEHPGPNAKGMQYMVENGQKYGNAFVIWYTWFKPVLSVSHPDSVKMVLKSSAPKPRGTLGTYELMFPWIGDGLLMSSGDKWFRNRRLLTPAFHFDVLKPYMKVYNDASDALTNKLMEVGGQRPVEIYTMVNLMTLDVILKCAFSYDNDIQRKGDSHPYVSAVVKIAELMVERLFKPWFAIDFLYNTLGQGREFQKTVDFAHQMTEEVIAKRKEQLRTSPEEPMKRYKDFLDILLLARDEDGNGLTDTEIQDEVDTFLFEGHDTTASAISWILYALAGHPEIQAQAQAEVDQLFAGRDTDHMTWEDMNEIPYTTLCIKEGLRLHSPVPFISRQTTQPLKINGIDVQPGTTVDVLIYCTHHNQRVWGPDHNEYKPERFLVENMKDMDSYAFIPFSAGPRNCIGQNFAMNEIKVAVCHMLHRFDLAVDPARPPQHQPELVMRAKGGMYLTATPRTHAN